MNNIIDNNLINLDFLIKNKQFDSLKNIIINNHDVQIDFNGSDLLQNYHIDIKNGELFKSNVYSVLKHYNDDITFFNYLFGHLLSHNGKTIHLNEIIVKNDNVAAFKSIYQIKVIPIKELKELFNYSISMISLNVSRFIYGLISIDNDFDTSNIWKSVLDVPNYMFTFVHLERLCLVFEEFNLPFISFDKNENLIETLKQLIQSNGLCKFDINQCSTTFIFKCSGIFQSLSDKLNKLGSGGNAIVFESKLVQLKKFTPSVIKDEKFSELVVPNTKDENLTTPTIFEHFISSIPYRKKPKVENSEFKVSPIEQISDIEIIGSEKQIQQEKQKGDLKLSPQPCCNRCNTPAYRKHDKRRYWCKPCSKPFTFKILCSCACIHMIQQHKKYNSKTIPLKSVSSVNDINNNNFIL